MKQPRMTKAWALFTPKGWIFYDSVRGSRRSVIAYAERGAPVWSWADYRKKGFYIAKVEIREASPALEGDGT